MIPRFHHHGAPTLVALLGSLTFALGVAVSSVTAQSASGMPDALVQSEQQEGQAVLEQQVEPAADSPADSPESEPNDPVPSEEVERTDAELAHRTFEEVDVELHRALDEHRGAFRHARSIDDPLQPIGDAELEFGETVGQLYEHIASLYAARMELLPRLSPERLDELQGNGAVGVRQALLELDYLERTIHYQRLAIPHGLRDVEFEVRASPVPAVLTALAVLAALFVFRLWRRWAGVGIPRLQQLVREAWGHRPAARPLGEVLRYVEAVRRPLEWLALSTFLFGFVQVERLSILEETLRICVTWILVAWFAVNLADAFASRGGVTRPEMRNKARLRSLRILAAWIVVLGLGLQLTRLLTGAGTLHSWVWDVFELLALPVVIALLLVWRPTIRQQLSREARFSDWVARLLERRGVLAAIWTTLGGLAYLALLGLRRLALKLVRRSGLGRSLVAEALRQSMAKAGGPGVDHHELDADVRKSWLRGGAVVESAVADELAEICDMLDRGWKSILLIGERGSGKSVLLNHLAATREEEVLVVSCPHGGADEAIAAIGRGLQLEGQQPSDAEVYEALRARGVRVIALDDVQRISRPMLGGQAELNQLIERTVDWSDIRLVAAIDSAAWEYFGRLREGVLTGASTVTLSAWTEGQIGELLDLRAREVGMELDYGGMRFPRYLLEQDFESPEEGLHASYRRILWGEAEGNPEVALRLVVERLVEKDDGDGLLQLPRSPSVSELDGMTLVELLVLRFILQTDGATAAELVAGLRFPLPAIEGVLDGALMRGLLEENHGRYRVTWQWFRMISRVLKRKNMLGAAPQKSERTGDAQVRGGRAVASSGGRR